MAVADTFGDVGQRRHDVRDVLDRGHVPSLASRRSDLGGLVFEQHADLPPDRPQSFGVPRRPGQHEPALEGRDDRDGQLPGGVAGQPRGLEPAGGGVDPAVEYALCG